MYSGYREAIPGFSKNIVHFFSINLVWMFFFIVFTTFGLLFIVLFSPPLFYIALGGAALGRVLISLATHQSVFRNLLMIPVQHVSFIQMVGRALVQYSRGSLEWKGRKISLK